MPIPLLLLGSGLAITGGVALWRVKDKIKNKTDSSNFFKSTKLFTALVSHNLLTRPHNQDINRNLIVSGLAIGSTAYSRIFCYPMLWVTVPLILYSSISIFSNALDGLVNEHKLRSSLIDSMAIVGTLASGYYFAAAFMSGLHFLGHKILTETQDHSPKQLEQKPGRIWLWRQGAEVEGSYDLVMAGDIIVISAGEVIPFDGRVEFGEATVDQQMLTGQAQLQEKTISDSVFATTLLIVGKLRIQVEKTEKDTLATQIKTLLVNTEDYKSTIKTRSEATADKLTWSTLALGGFALGTLGPMSAIKIVNSNFSDVVLVIPPLGVLNYQKLADQQGILIKDGRSLELLNQVDTLVFDKTGTLTLQQPEVKHIHGWRDMDARSILQLAAAVEHRQSHPVGRAILQAANVSGLELPQADHTIYESGFGIKAAIDGKTVHVGSSGFMQREAITVPKDIEKIELDSRLNGDTLVYVAVEGEISGAIELQESLRQEASGIIEALQQRGLNIHLISGDHERPTEKIAQALSIEHYSADSQPQDKARYIEKLQAEGRSVCFIGDGLNDTIAMKKAQVSISLSGASTAAVNTANIVMMDNNLEKLDCLFEFAVDFEKDMKTNTALALGPGVISIAGIFLFGLSIYNTMSLYALTLGVGAITTTLPLLKNRKLETIMNCNQDEKNARQE